jgi:hypothetical protein
MAPRGVKALLKKSAPAKLVGRGKLRGFRALRNGRPEGPKLRGLTKALERAVWSTGTLPAEATRSARRGWRGAGGGQRRGAAVDSQVSRKVNAGKLKREGRDYALTRVVFAALAEHGLEPVVAQRALCAEPLRLGTAADLLCYEEGTGRLCVVELKCGFGGEKLLPARDARGRGLKMRGPLRGACDCVLHRHMAQLAATRELLVLEGVTRRLLSYGVAPEINGALLYVTDDETHLYPLPAWWAERAPRLLAALKA